MTIEACAACPHQSDCLNKGSCLDDANAQFLVKTHQQFPSLMTPAQATECMAALEAGKTQRRICGGGSLGKPIVSLEKFKRHCTRYPIWGAKAADLAKVNAEAANALKGWKTGLTHCPKGHCYAVHGVARRRRGRKNGYQYCTACVKLNYTDPKTLPPTEVIDKVRRLLKEGVPVRQFTLAGTLGYVCKFSAVRAMRLLVPGINEMVLMNQSRICRIINPTITTIIKPNAVIVPRSTNLRCPALTGQIAGSSDYLFTMVDDVVSRNLPRDTRLEVISRLVLRAGWQGLPRRHQRGREEICEQSLQRSEIHRIARRTGI